MFNKKPRLVRVEINLKHGSSDMPDRTEVIEIGQGERFVEDIEGCYVMNGNRKVRFYDPRAGYTQDIRYFYQ